LEKFGSLGVSLESLSAAVKRPPGRFLQSSLSTGMRSNIPFPAVIALQGLHTEIDRIRKYQKRPSHKEAPKIWMSKPRCQQQAILFLNNWIHIGPVVHQLNCSLIEDRLEKMSARCEAFRAQKSEYTVVVFSRGLPLARGDIERQYC